MTLNNIFEQTYLKFKEKEELSVDKILSESNSQKIKNRKKNLFQKMMQRMVEECVLAEAKEKKIKFEKKKKQEKDSKREEIVNKEMNDLLESGNNIKIINNKENNNITESTMKKLNLDYNNNIKENKNIKSKYK